MPPDQEKWPILSERYKFWSKQKHQWCRIGYQICVTTRNQFSSWGSEQLPVESSLYSPFCFALAKYLLKHCLNRFLVAYNILLFPIWLSHQVYYNKLCTLLSMRSNSYDDSKRSKANNMYVLWYRPIITCSNKMMNLRLVSNEVRYTPTLIFLKLKDDFFFFEYSIIYVNLCKF